MNYHTINTFIEAVVNNLKEILEYKQALPWNNISKADKTILNEFSKKEDLVFPKADKGRATVIVDVKNYIKKANKILSNENYYKKLSQNLTQEHTKIFNDTVEIFQRQQFLWQLKSNKSWNTTLLHNT